MLNEEKKCCEEKLIAETQAREAEHSRYLVIFLSNSQLLTQFVSKIFLLLHKLRSKNRLRKIMYTAMISY